MMMITMIMMMMIMIMMMMMMMMMMTMMMKRTRETRILASQARNQYPHALARSFTHSSILPF